MQITIHRGTQEVGGTMIELKSKNTRILLDAGYPLFYRGEVIDDSWRKKSHQELLELGVIPRIDGLYHWQETTFDAVLISHGHSDHFGMLRYIHPDVPIWLSKETDLLISMSLGFPIRDYQKRQRTIFKMYEPFQIGDFTIKPYLVDHSAFQACAFELQCEGKTVLYTGDFRSHGRRPELTERFMEEAAKSADLLLMEGTTLGRTGEIERTEDELAVEFRKTIQGSDGIVLCQPTSQNIDRIISIYRAAKACGRILVMDPYTANLLDVLKKLGHDDLPVPSPIRPDLRVYHPVLPPQGIKQLMQNFHSLWFRLCSISAGSIAANQSRLVMLIRPSMLPDLMQMKLKNGTLIYSQWQAYRSKPPQQKMEAHLQKSGFRDVYIHTSGHAFAPALQKMITGLSPKEIVPIHTFCPAAFNEFSKDVSVKTDGVPFQL